MSCFSFRRFLPAVAILALLFGCSKESPAAVRETSPPPDPSAQGNVEFKQYFSDMCEMMLHPGPLVRVEFEANFDRASKWVQEAEHPRLTPHIFSYTLSMFRGLIKQHELRLYDPDGLQFNLVSGYVMHDLLGVSVYFIVVRLASMAQSESVRDSLIETATRFTNQLSSSRHEWRKWSVNLKRVSTVCEESVVTAQDKSIDCRSSVFKAGQWRLLTWMLGSELLGSGNWRGEVHDFIDNDTFAMGLEKLPKARSKAYLNCLMILGNQLDTLITGSAGNPSALDAFRESRDALLVDMDATNSKSLSTTSLN